MCFYQPISMWNPHLTDKPIQSLSLIEFLLKCYEVYIITHFQGKIILIKFLSAATAKPCLTNLFLFAVNYDHICSSLSKVFSKPMFGFSWCLSLLMLCVFSKIIVCWIYKSLLALNVFMLYCLFNKLSL